MNDLPTEVLDQVARAAAPLHPDDRDAFIFACVNLLKSEKIVGPGTINRIIRELLALGTYRVDVVTGAGRPRAGPHHGYDHSGRRGRHGKPAKSTNNAA
jgi:hypothetical protein